MAHHGNTPAAWTGVLIILVGFVVGGLGARHRQLADVLGRRGDRASLGPIVGKIMQKMGLGAEAGEPATESRH